VRAGLPSAAAGQEPTKPGTLYSLSKEGRGTAGPLVTALTVAVVEPAAQSAGGRLATPLVGVLDEAANVCRWRELPNLYSHYGSRGIVLDTVLQSWSQGVKILARPIWHLALLDLPAGCFPRLHVSGEGAAGVAAQGLPRREVERAQRLGRDASVLVLRRRAPVPPPGPHDRPRPARPASRR